ncbi:MAG TPA: hypothetical protein VM537_21915 [Anaerolineae bacterium]|nr:hypothetical protein [Anaerolineae bacterium]
MAITLSGGTTVGQQGLGGTIKMTQKAVVQFDIAGTYVALGSTSFSTFIKTITGIGSRATVVSIQQAGITKAGGYILEWDRSTDALRIYGTGNANKAPLTELGAGEACALSNVEMVVEFV